MTQSVHVLLLHLSIKVLHNVLGDQSPLYNVFETQTATSGCVIVISTPANSINAVWGGLMAQRAKMLGVKGTIIDGNCRDLVELQDMQFPVFSRGHSALSANQYTRASTINQPVVIAGCQINPGDIVVADVDGVVVFPADVIDRVVEEAKKLTEIDGKCMNDIGRGISVQQAFATHRGK
jgi:regulator of RNase E activity RraA